MTKTKQVLEKEIASVIDSEEKEGWQFISMTQSSPAKTYFEPVPRSFPAIYILVFKKADQTHNDVP